MRSNDRLGINHAPTADAISRHTQSSILRNTYPELIL